MPLELRPDSQFWYGRYKVNGRRVAVSLEIAVAGTRPASLKDQGDEAFEMSREQAKKKLDGIIAQAHSGRDATYLVERLYEIKTGDKVKSPLLKELADEWARIPRRRALNPRYAAQSRATLARFTAFVRERNDKVSDLAGVSRRLAEEFMSAEEARGVTAKTWNDTLKLLRATCKYLLPPGGINPFGRMPTRETETVFRKPFDPDELKAIVEAAQNDDFIRPILITGICTAMRRGDCCLLKWSDVDLPKRFITVKTAKTGVTVAIPIFPMLYDELARLPRNTRGYVFPEAAAMYTENADGITWRVRKVFAAAGFKDAEEGEAKDGHDTGDGQQNGQPIRGEIHVERTGGLRRASVRDFHSLRVTWVTLALTASVPLELVQRVTGHKTVDVVLKHYFQPGREDFRRALQAAMPKLLTNGAKTPKEQMLEILEATTAKTWKNDAARLRSLVAAL